MEARGPRPRFLRRREYYTTSVFSWTGPPMPTINIRTYLVWTVIRYRLNFVFTAVETERSSNEEKVPQCKAIRVKYVRLR